MRGEISLPLMVHRYVSKIDPTDCFNSYTHNAVRLNMSAFRSIIAQLSTVLHRVFMHSSTIVSARNAS
jgi:hypothetical protein